MATVQLNFALRTSDKCKTVHLLGSWDSYKGQLPLSKDTTKSGGWKGTFRFPSKVLKQGQRYWFYYIIDGYHVSHDPARPSVTEPTTGRKLNTLDIPPGDGTKASANKSPGDARHSRRPSTLTIAKGRPLSVSEIKSPRPHKPPQETQRIRQEQFRLSTIEQLNSQMSNMNIGSESDEEEDSSDGDSDSDSDVPSLTSRSSNSSTPSSVSSTSSCCTCERYGITRAGDRVKLDCGGNRCGYSDSGSDCSSDSDSDYRKGTTRRNGVIMRASPQRVH